MGAVDANEGSVFRVLRKAGAHGVVDLRKLQTSSAVRVRTHSTATNRQALEQRLNATCSADGDESWPTIGTFLYSNPRRPTSLES